MLSAVAFLTILGGSRPPGRSTFAWFPVVGAALGGVLALVAWGADAVWIPPVAAAVVLAADAALTGMLHLDGLADSADGLLPHLDRERRLAVMARPDVGAFALVVVPVVLLLRWSALLGRIVEPAALVALWAAARTLAAIVPAVVPYARDAGLASAFVGGSRVSIAWWLLPIAGGAALLDGVVGVGAVAGGVAAGGTVVALARRRIGGFTGDVLGAAIVVTETVGLLILALDR